MSGYRQSNYDPKDYERLGRPLRPYNWVQWLGVAFGVAGAAVLTLHLAGRMGWIAPFLATPLGAVGLFVVGSTLINSRREPAPGVTPAQQATNRRWLVVTTILCALILGVATFIELSGAN